MHVLIVEDDEELRASLARAVMRAGHGVEPAGTCGEALARAGAPYRTGKLRDSIVKRFVVPVPQGLSITVIALASYSLFVHEGTRAHVIAARKANSLAFFWPNGPNGPGLYFFKSVNHPGTVGIPFLRDALRHVVHA